MNKLIIEIIKALNNFLSMLVSSKLNLYKVWLVEYIKKDKKQVKLSFYDHSKDIAGSSYSHSDLSTNKKHFEYYGS